MTENKWLNFAGFLNGCVYGLKNNACPFSKFHQLDQYQKLEYLLHISEKEATEMLHSCENHRENCQKSNRKMPLRSLELELGP